MSGLSVNPIKVVQNILPEIKTAHEKLGAGMQAARTRSAPDCFSMKATFDAMHVKLDILRKEAKRIYDQIEAKNIEFVTLQQEHIRRMSNLRFANLFQDSGRIAPLEVDENPVETLETPVPEMSIVQQEIAELIERGDFIRRGTRDDSDNGHIREVQTLLFRAGFLPEDGIDGSFGPQTQAALREFQEANGIVTSGAVGPATWTVLSGANNSTRVETPVEEQPFTIAENEYRDLRAETSAMDASNSPSPSGIPTALPSETIAYFENQILPRMAPNMERYLYAAQETGLPWQLFAALHFREATMNPNQSILNGQEFRSGSFTNVDGITVVSNPLQDAVNAGNHFISNARGIYGVELTSNSSIDDWGYAFLAYNRGNMFRINDVSYTRSPYVMTGLTSENLSMPWIREDSYAGGNRLNGLYDRGAVERRPGALPALIYFFSLNENDLLP